MMVEIRSSVRAAVLALLFIAAGCSDTGHSPVAPHVQQPSALVNGTLTSFTLIEGKFPEPAGNGATCDVYGRPDASPARLRSATWIGPLGGAVILAGGEVSGKVTAHVLEVPPFAVTGRTLFCMKLQPDNHMQVHLQAHAVDARNRLVDVGERGFRIPVVLTMSYASVNLSSGLASRVVILHDPEDGSAFEKMKGVSLPALNIVVAELPHFSKYAMAVD